METVNPATFDDIRPVNDNEVPQAIEDLIASDGLWRALSYIAPDADRAALSDAMRACRTKAEFKSTIGYKTVMAIARRSTFSLTISGRSRLPADKAPCTFISNHRDIVLDAAFLNVLLYDVGYDMTQIAIGDNLLITPWIRLIVRLNNSFIVKRNVSARRLLENSRVLSEYIRHTLRDTHESIWIAQREGRAKDSNDHTQTAVLKMLCMAGQADNLLENLMELNIVPIAISYEYDPCDYLKAREFQLKRDNPHYTKTERDDLLSMQTGIMDDKGRVHFTIGSPLNDTLRHFDPATPRNEMLTAAAAAIDRDIYAHYRFYPGNYVAYDLLHASLRFRMNYDQRDKARFEAYLRKQIDRIDDLPNKDEAFLRTKLLEMYANPLKNHWDTKTE